MGNLKHKGYTGSVEYSEEDDCLFGKVLGMNKHHISYEGATIEGLKSDFTEAINDYLADCKEEGILPKKPYTGVLNIRISPEAHSKIAMLAKNKSISINAYIKETLQKRLDSA